MGDLSRMNFITRVLEDLSRMNFITRVLESHGKEIEDFIREDLPDEFKNNELILTNETCEIQVWLRIGKSELELRPLEYDFLEDEWSCCHHDPCDGGENCVIDRRK